MTLRCFLKYISRSVCLEVYHNNRRVWSGLPEDMESELMDKEIEEDSAFPNTYGEMEVFIK